jgi:uncharacterized protein YndB with AHSA1/START domain
MVDTTTGSAKVTLPTDEQILITREFNAPKHLVYKAYTTPELVKKWWAGRRGTTTSAEIDLRVGGQWRYVLVADGGFEVAFHGEYREIVPNERIVFTEVYETPELSEDDATLNTTTFTETGGRTVLTILTECRNQELRDAIINSGMEGGMQEGMDIMEEIAVSLG